jgi:putative ABC transport system permease protein
LAVLVPLAVTEMLGLGLGKSVLIAMARSAVQLGLLAGVILVPLFEASNRWLVLGYLCFMFGLAGREASAKLKWRYAGVVAHGVLAAVLGAGAAVTVAVLCVIHPEPLHDPRVVAGDERHRCLSFCGSTAGHCWMLRCKGA